jgi:type II secretory ATPase GspE/PulE/Tfp pilus assembly ATPase PilB-like protein
LFELWHLDEISRQLIVDGADGAALEKQACHQGMVALADDAMAKVTAGVISLSEVRALGGINHPAADHKE